MERERLEKAIKLDREFDRLKLLSKMIEHEVINFGLSNDKMTSYHVSVDSEELNNRLAVVLKQYLKERMASAQKEFLEL